VCTFQPHDQLIDDPNHHQMERIRRLQTRAERERTGLYYIEGMRFVARAISHGVPIVALVACPQLLTHPFTRHLVRRRQRAGTPILTVTPEVIPGLGSVEEPQGIGAVVRQHSTPTIRRPCAPPWVPSSGNGSCAPASTSCATGTAGDTSPSSAPHRSRRGLPEG